MDCLDRTNVVQSLLARHILTLQLRESNILPVDSPLPTLFEPVFRNAWADNADAVSRAYSGTGALKTDYTRTGIRSTAGVLADASNSATRWLRNNFADGPRQDAFDLFLGVHVPGTSTAVFADRRPLVVQAVPYFLAAAGFLVVLALLTPKDEERAVAPLRLFVVVWFAVGVWASVFLVRYGELFVCWPKLAPEGVVVEGYRRALEAAGKDEVVGQWVGGPGGVVGRVLRVGVEEVKKRVE